MVTDHETSVELRDAAGNVVGAARMHHDPDIDLSCCYPEPAAAAAGE